MLAASPPSSVVIASIGFVTNLQALLQSPPDAISPLTGLQLVASRVRLIAWMGGMYPASSPQNGEWNFSHDGIGPSTQFTVSSWPGQRMFSGFEIGVAIMTGGIMSNSTPATNPCRQAYIGWRGKREAERVRGGYKIVALMSTVVPVALVTVALCCCRRICFPAPAAAAAAAAAFFVRASDSMLSTHLQTTRATEMVGPFVLFLFLFLLPPPYLLTCLLFFFPSPATTQTETAGLAPPIGFEK